MTLNRFALFDLHKAQFQIWLGYVLAAAADHMMGLKKKTRIDSRRIIRLSIAKFCLSLT